MHLDKNAAYETPKLWISEEAFIPSFCCDYYGIAYILFKLERKWPTITETKTKTKTIGSYFSINIYLYFHCALALEYATNNFKRNTVYLNKNTE